MRTLPPTSITPVALLLSILGSVACSADPTVRDDLPQCVLDFSEALRWKHLPAALKFVSPDHREAFINAVQAAAKEAEVLDFEVVALNVQPDGKSAQATVMFSYMRSGNLTLVNGVEIQHWSLRDGNWVLIQQVGPETPGAVSSPFVVVPETSD